MEKRPFELLLPQVPLELKEKVVATLPEWLRNGWGEQITIGGDVEEVELVFDSDDTNEDEVDGDASPEALRSSVSVQTDLNFITPGQFLQNIN